MRSFLSNFRTKLFILLAVIGPGLITAFADNDAGGVATYSVAAARYGYSMLLTLIPITIILLVTQEIGGRIAIVTGKGLGDLIRERYGLRISLSIFALLFIVNFGVILQNASGLKSALALFHLSIPFFLPLLVISLFGLILLASYSKIERVFLFLILFYMAYFFSAILAKPDWGLVVRSLFIPHQKLGVNYLYTSIAVLGTTVTLWGQFFISSFVRDKNVTPDHLKYNRLEIYGGAFLTDLFSLFMMVAVTATIFVHGVTIVGAADAALAIRPFAGELAGVLFGIGLLVAGLIGLAIVPLATAYAFSEFFGYERSLDSDFKTSRLFYGFFIFQIVLGTLVVMLPQISLFQMTLVADFLNGLALPVIFYFLYHFANDRKLMGEHQNSKFQNILLIGSGVLITVCSLVGGAGEFLHF